MYFSALYLPSIYTILINNFTYLKILKIQFATEKLHKQPR